MFKRTNLYGWEINLETSLTSIMLSPVYIWYNFNFNYIYIHSKSTNVVGLTFTLIAGLGDCLCTMDNNSNLLIKIRPMLAILMGFSELRSSYSGIWDMTKTQLSLMALHTKICCCVSSSLWHFLHRMSVLPILKFAWTSIILDLAAKINAFSSIDKACPDFKYSWSFNSL